MKHGCLQWQLGWCWDDLWVATWALLSQRMDRRWLLQGRQGCLVRGMGLHLGRAGLPEAHHPLLQAQIAGICGPLVEAGWKVGPGLARARQWTGGAAEEAAQRVGRVLLPLIVAWSAAVIGGGGR